MSRYADIVASENKSLNQQVGVLSEMLAQKDRENAKLKAECVEMELKINSKDSEILCYVE